MTPVTTTFHPVSYTVDTPIFAGPLDLLLQLIERAELDITRLALAQVTDQYLDYLKTLENQLADEVSAFIVIAARLIQIKSEALLPRPPIREQGEEDPGDALAKQLRLYKQFKMAAEHLSIRESFQLRSFLRLAPTPKVEGKLDLSGITINELVFAAYDIYENKKPSQQLSTVVRAPKVTIREKIGEIISNITKTGSFRFRNLFNRVSSRLEVVVTFLAMLELVKRHIVLAKQESLFGDISLEMDNGLDKNNSIDQDFELEFGE